MSLYTSSGIQNRLWERLIPYNPFTTLPSVENKSLGGGLLLGAWQLQPWPCPQKSKSWGRQGMATSVWTMERKGAYGKKR